MANTLYWSLLTEHSNLLFLGHQNLMLVLFSLSTHCLALISASPEHLMRFSSFASHCEGWEIGCSNSSHCRSLCWGGDAKVKGDQIIHIFICEALVVLLMSCTRAMAAVWALDAPSVHLPLKALWPHMPGRCWPSCDRAEFPAPAMAVGSGASPSTMHWVFS